MAPGVADADAIAQAPAEVGPQQIGATIGGRTVHRDVRQARLRRVPPQRSDIELGMHRIARRGVGRLEIEMRRGRQTVAGTAQRHARRREAPEVSPSCGG